MGMSFKERKHYMDELRNLLASHSKGIMVGEFLNVAVIKYGVSENFVFEFLKRHENFYEEKEGVIVWKK